jgi:hypothetical protein
VQSLTIPISRSTDATKHTYAAAASRLVVASASRNAGGGREHREEAFSLIPFGEIHGNRYGVQNFLAVLWAVYSGLKQVCCPFATLTLLLMRSALQAWEP